MKLIEQFINIRVINNTMLTLCERQELMKVTNFFFWWSKLISFKTLMVGGSFRQRISCGCLYRILIKWHLLYNQTLPKSCGWIRNRFFHLFWTFILVRTSDILYTAENTWELWLFYFWKKRTTVHHLCMVGMTKVWLS